MAKFTALERALRAPKDELVSVRRARLTETLVAASEDAATRISSWEEEMRDRAAREHAARNAALEAAWAGGAKCAPSQERLAALRDRFQAA